MSEPEGQFIKIQDALPETPLVCIHHGDYHPFQKECAEAAVDYYFQAECEGLTEEQMRHRYQMEAEQKILENIVKELRDAKDV